MIAIDIDERGCGGDLAGAGGGAEVHFFEAPVAEVAIEAIGTVNGAEINIDATVAVHVAERDAGAIVGDSVGEIKVAVEFVCKSNAGCGGAHQSETDLSCCDWIEWRASIPVRLGPGKIGLRPA